MPTVALPPTGKYQAFDLTPAERLLAKLIRLEAARVRAAKWHWNNKERANAKSREWSAGHREIAANRTRKWYADNKKRHMETTKAYQARNKEVVKARLTRYRKKNADQVRVWKRNYKARKKNAIGTHTAKDIAALMILQRAKCAECRITLGPHHVDHIVPLVLGGANSKDNLQLLCPKCNLIKRATDPIKFAQAKGRLL